MAPDSARRRLALVLGSAILVAAIVVTGLVLWHQRRLLKEAQRRQSAVDRGPRVAVTRVANTPAVREIDLPADVRAFTQATLYAKVSGYVKAMRVDKGDAVRSGQILAVLESPELDQQVAAAAADLAIKQRTYERYRPLLAQDFVSAQDYDVVKAQYEVAVATLAQAKATQAYEVLRAPFDGSITLRYVDPGALVPAGTGSTSAASPLLDLADLRRLRVTIFVQQDLAPFIKVGEDVELSSDERPGLRIAAHVSRITQSLDPQSRTMRCEIWVDNHERIYPGTFVHAKMHIAAPPRPMVPSNALVVREGKTLVAVVEEGRIALVPVEAGLNDGKQVQLLRGEVRAGQLIALDLPGEIEEHAPVQPVEPKPAQKPTAPPAAHAEADR
jgi:RND family efflux transporter MFP subunit